MPATHPHPQLQDVHGRDPRLRQPADQQQLPSGERQPSRCSRASSCPSTRWSLPALPSAPPRRSARARRPRTASRSSPPLRSPANSLELRQELAHPGAIRRRDPRARELPCDRVDPLRRDPRPKLIHAHHQRHHTTPSIATTPASTHAANRNTRSASHTVNHGRYLLFEWPAARLQSARAFHAVRRGGPATFTRQITRQPGDMPPFAGRRGKPDPRAGVPGQRADLLAA
jgi:hypothetical protein